MSTEPKSQDVIALLIPHPTQPQLLVQAVGEELQLPAVAIGQVWDGPIGRINAAVQEQFGLETTVVRQLAEHSAEAQPDVYLYRLENLSSHSTLPSGLRWISMTELNRLTLHHSTHHSAVESCCQEIISSTIPPRRAPWEQPGWLRPTVAWITDQLRQIGIPATGPVEQVKHWVLSCILRMPTAQGWVYFKAGNGTPLMVNEAVLIQLLARLYPAVMPRPLAIDAARDWSLLADFGSEIGWTAPVETREAALTAFAALQIASAAAVDELLTCGCIDRRLPKVIEEIPPLLNDSVLLAMLDPAQQERLLAAAPRLGELCTQMAAYHVPATLVHGDLHMSNIARGEAHGESQGFIFFDWSDACVAHPFMDVIAILHEKDETVQTRLRDAYLAAWTPYASSERLLELWQLAYPICALHQAVSYRYIAHHIEGGYDHPMVQWAIPYWFGKILDTL